MSVRQYIGARYVPKFFENSATNDSTWAANTAYEPLTIVTWNGNSYTSKKAVTAGVGNPSENPEYWASTGMYNQQVESLRLQVESLSSDVDVIEDVVNRLKNKIIVLIGDSWIEGGEMVNYLLQKDSSLVLNENLFYRGNGGSGFSVSASGGTTFAGSIPIVASAVTSAGVDLTDVTDVIFMGGVNDSGTAPGTLVTAGNSAIETCKSTFPNARILICPLTANAAPAGRENIVQNTINAYSRMNAPCCVYAPLVIHSLNLLQSDGIHPNTAGMERCATYLLNVINGKDVIPGDRFGQGATAKTGYTLGGHAFYTFVEANTIRYNFSDISITLDTAITVNDGVSVDFGHFANNALSFLPIKQSGNLYLQNFPVNVICWNSNNSEGQFFVVGNLVFSNDGSGGLDVSLYFSRGQEAAGKTANRFIILGTSGIISV